MSGFRFVPGPESYAVGFLFFDWTVVARNTAMCWDLDDMRRAHAHSPKPESYILYGEALTLYHKHSTGYRHGILSGLLKDAYHSLKPPPGREFYTLLDQYHEFTARRDGGLLVVLHERLDL